MSFKSAWKDFFGFADEREEAEANRIARRAFYILVALVLIIAYYLMQLSQVAMVHDLNVGPYSHLAAVAFALCVAVLASCLYVIFAQTRRGIMGSSRFSNSDKFNWGFASAVSAVASLIIAVVLFLCRCLAELVLVGASEVYWVGNFAIGIIFFVVLFVLVVFAFNMTFKSAKKKQAQILSELEAAESEE